MHLIRLRFYAGRSDKACRAQTADGDGLPADLLTVTMDGDRAGRPRDVCSYVEVDLAMAGGPPARPPPSPRAGPRAIISSPPCRPRDRSANARAREAKSLTPLEFARVLYRSCGSLLRPRTTPVLRVMYALCEPLPWDCDIRRGFLSRRVEESRGAERRWMYSHSSLLKKTDCVCGTCFRPVKTRLAPANSR